MLRSLGFFPAQIIGLLPHSNASEVSEGTKPSRRLEPTHGAGRGLKS